MSIDTANSYILSLLVFLPLLAGFFLLPIKIKNNLFYYSYAIFFAIIELIIAIALIFKFDFSQKTHQFIDKFSLISKPDINYFIGLDGLSFPLILLTVLLIPFCLLLSINSIKHRVKEFVICFLLIETCIIGSFVSLDLFAFYFFFEASLVPMFFIIGIFGGENKVYAAYKFFLYTLAGSVFFLVAIIAIALYFNTSNIELLTKILPEKLPLSFQKLFFILFLASFAIKIPMFPVHTWLPDAHVQAPTAGSVLLAGVLIKMGAYALIRFSLPFFPQAAQYFSNYILIFSIIAIVYGSIVALAQEDMKKMIAYSSVAHMGFVTLGIFSFTHQGISAAIMQMISHGLVSSALFICVGVVYDRLHTKKIADLGGLAHRMPQFAVLTFIFVMGAVGLPGTSGFVGEFLSIMAVFSVNKIYALIAGLAIVLGALYMLILYRKVWLQEITNHKVNKISDLNLFEKTALITLSSLVILFGFAPNLVLQFFNDYSLNIANIFVSQI
jgi:NADH-quinone oxidoreductase subunit M